MKSVEASEVKSSSLVSGELVKGLLRFSRCELLLLEVGSCGRGQLGNPGEGERPLPSNV
jgi:hypothetical protein